MSEKFLNVVFLLLAGWLQTVLMDNIKIGTEVIGNIITFLSISFGFYITSITIFATSKYVPKLYQTVDPQDSSVTLLHTLLNRYRHGLIINLISLIYYLILLLNVSQIEDKYILLNDINSFLFVGLFFLNIFYFYLMLDKLIKIVLQSSKK